MDAKGAAAPFGLLYALGLDASNNLCAVGTQNIAIQRITPEGDVSTVAGNGHSETLLDFREAF